VLAVIGGLVLAPQALPASATMAAPTVAPVVPPAPVPPTGTTWIQGVLTDQANHAIDNVNVEVWPNDPAATQPLASNLSYGGTPADGRHNHGAYRVEVPSNVPYIIVFSAVGGAEDGDAYRMQSYGEGRPLMVRPTTRSSRTLAKAGAPGRVRDLGTTQLVHQGRVSSSIKAKLGSAKVKAGGKGKLTVTVTSPFVSNVTGKLTVKVAGKKLTNRLGASDRGKATINLPKMNKPGAHQIVASFGATGTVEGATAKPVKLTITKPKPKKHKK
jgi:hypothetical protein